MRLLIDWYSVQDEVESAIDSAINAIIDDMGDKLNINCADAHVALPVHRVTEGIIDLAQDVTAFLKCQAMFEWAEKNSGDVSKTHENSTNTSEGR